VRADGLKKWLPGRALEPGDAVHFVSLLDEAGNTLTTVVMERPLEIKVTEAAQDVYVDVRMTVTFKLESRAK